ncbi:fatty acyl-CoA reductase wat-like [Lycorma delicatula]|uniref:fatty acyl-CoA reductase wat-like n=1 Tax=Lycorma delicatula TaxID=130591 RepID=UPI003F50FD23
MSTTTADTRTLVKSTADGVMDTDISETPIQEFYRGETILITGGTGFLGRIIIEKLMRSCPNFNKMYLIVRPKKGKDQKQRLKEQFDDFLFSQVNPSIFEKVSLISGDCAKPMLGLSSEDQKELQENVTIVIHSAATVKFDEPLQLAVAINITATRDLLTLSKGMKNLKAFVHVSTAYSNCHLSKIEETFYTPSLESKKLITLTECLDNQQLDQLTPILLKDVPNTYVYTKAVAEELVKRHSKGIPAAVVRPSIIVASNKEPVPGWIDNLYGPSGVVVASTTGIMRIMECDPDLKADVVPVDMVANAILASAWHLDNRRNKDSIEDPPIYNMVSSTRNPITWLYFFTLCYRFWPHTVFAIWYPFITIHKSRLKVRILKFLLHYLPALVIDSIAQVFGKQTGLLKISEKIEKFTKLVSYFSIRQWEFYDKNTQDLWESLNQKDKEIFPFNVEELNWEEYFYNYMRGARKYLLKDDLSSIPIGIKRVQRLYWLHCASLTFLTFIAGNIVWYWFGSIIMYYLGLIYNYYTESSTNVYAEKMQNVLPIS